MTGGFAFMPDALEANAAGQLTETQRAMFEDGSLVMRVLPTVTGDLHKGAVAAVDGAVRKKMPINVVHDGQAEGTQHYALEVGGVDYEVPSRRVWEDSPPVGWVRLYYLPRSKVAVNLQILPDPPVESSPQDVAGSFRDVLGSVFSPGLTKRSRIKRAERAAHAQAVVRSAMGGVPEPQASSTQPVVPQNAGDLVGAWKSMFFNVDVRADGTLTIENAQGADQPGKWNVDPQGQLHVQFDGDEDDLVTPFTVGDGQLSIQFDNQRMTFQRSS